MKKNFILSVIISSVLAFFALLLYQKFSILNHKVADLENRVSNLNSQITDLESEKSGLESRIDDLENDR